MPLRTVSSASGSRFEVVDGDINVHSERSKGPPGNKSPTERSGLRMASDRNYVYLIGGYSPVLETVLRKEVWRFNVLTDCWELMDIPVDDFPEELASFASCFFGDPDLSEFYVFGGTAVPFGFQCSSSVSVLKFSGNGRNTWKRLEAIGDIPRGQYGSCLVFCKGKFYVIGGTTGWEYNLEVRSLEPVRRAEGDDDDCGPDLSFWKWTLLNDGRDVNGRYRHEAVVVGDEIVLIGGGTPEWASPLEELLIFNIPAKEFRTQQTYPDDVYGCPKSRLCHGCVKFGDSIYLHGGCTERRRPQQGVASRPKLFEDFWKLDLSTWCWRRLPVSLFEKICFHASTITPDGCVYVFGGTTDGKFENRTDKLQRCWINPPSLFHLAARVIVDSCPNLSDQFHDLRLTNIVTYIHSLLV